MAGWLEAKLGDTVLAFPGPCFRACPWEGAPRGNQGKVRMGRVDTAVFTPRHQEEQNLPFENDHAFLSS